MRRALPLFLICLPLAEVAGFVLVGGWLGLWPTLALTVASAVLGVLLVRAQGIGVFRRALAALEAGRPPVRELFDGMLLAIAGGLLVVPGFVSDAIGLLLLIPAARAHLIALFAARILARRREEEGVIEGDWVEVVNELPPRRGE